MVLAAEGVIASVFEVVRVDEVESLEESELGTLFSESELAYARSKRDPGRRLAARLAAKRAACRALGGDARASDVTVERRPGSAPTLRFEATAAARLAAVGAAGSLVSLTHEGELAAASVLLLQAPRS